MNLFIYRGGEPSWEWRKCKWKTERGEFSTCWDQARYIIINSTLILSFIRFCFKIDNISFLLRLEIWRWKTRDQTKQWIEYCNFGNSHNDLCYSQVHIKIHLLEVLTRTNQFRITCRLSSASFVLELLWRFAHLRKD